MSVTVNFGLISLSSAKLSWVADQDYVLNSAVLAGQVLLTRDGAQAWPIVTDAVMPASCIACLTTAAAVGVFSLGVDVPRGDTLWVMGGGTTGIKSVTLRLTPTQLSL